ncbi:MAG TPA: RNA polymerase sigma factor [Blastocatellia bacterium]|nr:RNA polymerase sigma factor [Blastocatellia bacterium]
MRGNHKSHSKADEGGVRAAARSVVTGASSGEGEQAAPDRTSEGELSRSSPRTAREPAACADEDELIRRSLKGDQDAFEALVRRYSPRVFNIIGSFFRRRDMVEDIAQEVFARSYFSLSSFTLGRSFEAWVAKIAVNACYDHLRAQRRRIEYQMPRTAEQEDEWLELQMLDVAASRHASLERQREAADISERLLAKLDPEDRLVLVLMDRDGHSVKEISDLTGWGQSKIKVRAFRARRTLRAEMKRLLISAERKQRSAK